MQHLPSLPFVLRLFFLQVHQTNIPATARAATDPNTAPTTIPMIPTMRDKLQIIFSNDLIMKNLPLYFCYGQETFGIQFIFFPQFCVSQFITYIELHRLQCVIIYLLRKKIGDTNSVRARLKEVMDNL